MDPQNTRPETTYEENAEKQEYSEQGESQAGNDKAQRGRWRSLKIADIQRMNIDQLNPSEKKSA